jgi:hypothetical protein
MQVFDLSVTINAALSIAESAVLLSAIAAGQRDICGHKVGS